MNGNYLNKICARSIVICLNSSFASSSHFRELWMPCVWRRTQAAHMRIGCVCVCVRGFCVCFRGTLWLFQSSRAERDFPIIFVWMLFCSCFYCRSLSHLTANSIESLDVGVLLLWTHETPDPCAQRVCRCCSDSLFVYLLRYLPF